MRLWFLIITIVISSGVCAQNRNDPFVGGIELGIGYGTVIDFKLDNNNFYREHLLHRLLWLPFQIGFVSEKYLNPNEYLEFGILFARRSSSYTKRHYSADGSYGTGVPALDIYCIDFPLKYYAYAGKILKQQMFAYGGIIPSWIIEPLVYSDHCLIAEDCFRNFYFSVCGGLCFDKKKSRMKLHAGLAVTSVANAKYREIPQEDRNYGGRIYPFELLFCYARMFR
jgi:hypothetical protein